MTQPIIRAVKENYSNNYLRLTASAPSGRAPKIAQIKELCNMHYAVARPIRKNNGRAFIDLMVQEEMLESLEDAIYGLEVSKGGFFTLKSSWGSKGKAILAHQSYVVTDADNPVAPKALRLAEAWILSQKNTGVTEQRTQKALKGDPSDTIVLECAIPVEKVTAFETMVTELNQQ